MKIVLETADLAHCSPATVSRCAVIYMEENEDLMPLKSHINKWIKSWPAILFSEIDRLDMTINYFLEYITDHFLHRHMQVHPVSKK
jgi:hypothetical protein